MSSRAIAIQQIVPGFSSVYLFNFSVKFLMVTEILELQQRFEEDKKKIMALRLARKFRPY